MIATICVAAITITLLSCTHISSKKPLADNVLLTVRFCDGNQHVLSSTYEFQDNGKYHYTQMEDDELQEDYEQSFDVNKEKRVIFFPGMMRDLAIIFDLTKQTCKIVEGELARSYVDGNPGIEDYFDDSQGFKEEIDQVNWDAVKKYFNDGE